MPTRYIGDGYWEIASRQMSIVTRSEQERFKDAKITVIGCGGIGGETIEMLARMGIGELVLVDKDAFDLSNLNRQTMASIADLGLDKEAVACAAKTGRVIVAHDHNKVSGFGTYVGAAIAEAGIATKFEILGAPDKYVPLATTPFLYEINEYDAKGLVKHMKAMLED